MFPSCSSSYEGEFYDFGSNLLLNVDEITYESIISSYVDSFYIKLGSFYTRNGFKSELFFLALAS